MLIDFKKCLTLYHGILCTISLSFLGYSKNFIKWIRLFNYDIIAYILHCGKLSEKVFIGRGCRQGDPISPYLFLLAAEILSMLIKSNANILGIKINNEEFKISQFADDTTLILGGSQGSLQAALSTLEVYGSYSSLKMNKEKKTKIIWTGRKRYSN